MTKRLKIYYSVDNSDIYSFVSNWGHVDSILDADNDDLPDFAQDAAEDYHRNHDGWESVWPVVVTLYTDDSEEAQEVAKFKVDRVPVPSFEAYEIKEENK